MSCRSVNIQLKPFGHKDVLLFFSFMKYMVRVSKKKSQARLCAACEVLVHKVLTSSYDARNCQSFPQQQQQQQQQQKGGGRGVVVLGLYHAPPSPALLVALTFSDILQVPSTEPSTHRQA
jgi:hypothetical protein